MKTYALYARILRLMTDFQDECLRRADLSPAMQVIVDDADLVWC